VKFVLLLALVGCSAATAPSHPEPPDTGTRLVVLLVLDQWPEWSFEAKQNAFHGGFARALAEGEWHVGEHPSAATMTAPGHALLGTGAPSARSGILANEWWHRDLHRVLMSVEGEDDAETTKWLRVRGLGDAVAASPGKAVAISLKSRAALLPLGHAGLAVWYDPHAARFRAYQLAHGTPAATTTPWLEAYTSTSPIEPRLEPWTPLPDTAQLAGVPDDNPGEVGGRGFGPSFPHDPQQLKHPPDALFDLPLGNDVLLEIALAAIAGEQLGTRRSPDLLVISLSAHDYVGHGWGHESQEQWDMERRLDDSLASFLAALDQQVGPGRWSMVITSDHGASPLPETIHGGRLTFQQVHDAANAAASAVLGPGTWIDNAHYPNVYFSDAFFAQPAGEQKSAITRVLSALRSFPSIEKAGVTADVEGHCDSRTGDARALCLTFDPSRSGDLYYLPARGFIMDSADEPAATAHGSLHDYDREVPLLILPPGRGTHAAQSAPSDKVPMETVAPLLAKWLGVKL
jgi:hypothetical protein